ncbi:tail fiber protein [Mesorhizobium sp.]|uniref:tail fiber protein n=1 Tax=Mesorhizobium sp. TaxID=1871066 RepID=UPI0025BE8D42|nr:tail fiber protein [Mesorhizobium sp.]
MPKARNSLKIKGEIVASLSNAAAEGTCAIPLGLPTSLTLLLANQTDQSFVLVPRNGAAPTLRLDFTELSPAVAPDPAQVSCPWFTATAPRPGIIELALAAEQYDWLRLQYLAVRLNDLVLTGGAGLGLLEVTLERFHPHLTWQRSLPLMKLETPAAGQLTSGARGAGPAAYRHQTTGGSLQIEVRPSAARPDLAAAPAGQPEIVVGITTANSGKLQALTSSKLGGKAQVTAHGWTAERIEGSSTPFWRLVPKSQDGPWLGRPGPRSAVIEIGNLFTDQSRRGHLALYSANIPDRADGYQTVFIDAASGQPTISSFTISPSDGFGVIDTPQTAYLSWATSNAAYVVLSGVGVVPTGTSNFQVTVEKSTTFILTAFDSTLQLPQSLSVTATISPDPESLLVTAGTMINWGGPLSALPANWLLCDGSAYDIDDYPNLYAAIGTQYGGDGQTTFNVPDLTNAFVVGAGSQSAEPPQTGGGPDTHTHDVGLPTQTVAPTVTTDPGHDHVVPNAWYARSLSSTDHEYCQSVCAPSFSQGSSSNPTTVQSGGAHTHQIPVSFPDQSSGTNSVGSTPDVGVRPPWYSLCCLIKT